MSRKKSNKKLRALIDAPLTISAENATLSQMPKYNGYAGGYGAHGKRGYDRKRSKKDLARQLRDAGY